MPKRVMQGVVESNKSLKTLIVRVERRYKHPLYKKTVKKSKKYSVHYNDGNFEIGQGVRIIECAPMSKTKKWQILK